MFFYIVLFPMSLINLQNINKSYVSGEIETPVLHDVSLRIEQGEFVAIMGPSGSGKSTLMHILGFLDTATSGKFLFEGQDVSGLSDNELAYMRRTKVGFVFQSFNLLARASVLENVVLPMIYEDVDSEKREREARRVLEEVGLSHRLKNLSNQLSGGERQRVAIARALVGNPSIIYADEPTGNLDTKSGEEILKLFQKINKEGNTIVMITHEREAAEFARRIVSIRDGNIIDESVGHVQRIGSFKK